ncbi:ABC transporter ATP-binding protein [Litchfieldella anticariensis FP35 = DSM 16096]|uniref:ABC transporter ATP-binding protein n=1 Tax=Litchfieldella anticariensis (strain DSM 16096 / CECT 5854 / CIP 108499 / LMG 22089 / FP35) TaxID=1121939 RepID=S2LG69_LITA3|nr:ABC transporter ATP-binding protein [Halomonas anticariensis]EPC03686.1 ABC transporter ATP-binding protein [Halomonas anticariensis FP35 = DSM 16096]
MSTELRVTDLVTGYGKQEIVHGVSMAARSEEVTCVFGPNGSGKSTVIKAIAGLLPAWSGRLYLGDRELTGLAVHEVVRRGIVMMPQGGGVFPRFTVMENLRMGGYSLRDTSWVEDRIETLIGDYPSLQRRRHVAAGSLSGGEQMMVAIARALVPNPAFVLLDEPSAGLSPALVSETMTRVKGLRERGIGVVMIEQNIREALPIADRLYILAGGHQKFAGTAADIQDDRHLMSLYMGGDQ